MRRKETLKLLRLKEIARRMYVLRVSKNLTLHELSKITGITAKRIGRFENAKVLPQMEDLFKLSEALDVRPSYFFDMATAPKIVPIYPSLREVAEMLVEWVDSEGPSAEIPVDLIRALRNRSTQEKVRAFLKLDVVLPECHASAIEGVVAARVATFPPVSDLTHTTHPLGESKRVNGDGGE